MSNLIRRKKRYENENNDEENPPDHNFNTQKIKQIRGNNYMITKK